MGGPNADWNATILKLVDAGLTFAQVARGLGLTRSTVAGVVYRATERRAWS